MGRIESVFPVPVPATIPNPWPPRASSRISAPCSRSSSVSMWSRSASSIVSQAARVGAMTMTRPVGGSAATNAAWSGGRERSLTSLSGAWIAASCSLVAGRWSPSLVSGRLGATDFASPGRAAGKMTLALGGLLRIAVAQSVGAGCRAAGTLSTQTRHMPGGGR
jgi:hypothetical protein